MKAFLFNHFKYVYVKHKKKERKGGMRKKERKKGRKERRRSSYMPVSAQRSPKRAESKESTHHLTHLCERLCESGSQVSSSGVIRSFALLLFFSSRPLSHTHVLSFCHIWAVCVSAQDVVTSKQIECVRRKAAVCFRNTHISYSRACVCVCLVIIL